MLADTASVDLVPLRIGEDTAAGEAADYWKPVIKELSSFGENVNNEFSFMDYIFLPICRRTAGFVYSLCMADYSDDGKFLPETYQG